MPSEKLVKDIMRPLNRYPAVRETDTVLDALRHMGGSGPEANPGCLLVVGEDAPGREVIKGYLSAGDLVFGLTAHFLKGAHGSGPIFWEGQLETECREGMNRRIDEIMVPIRGCVRETERLLEAVFLLHKYQVGFLPVVRREEVTGMIHLEDILREIAGIVLS